MSVHRTWVQQCPDCDDGSLEVIVGQTGQACPECGNKVIGWKKEDIKATLKEPLKCWIHVWHPVFERGSYV